jgi:hypothetical protein
VTLDYNAVVQALNEREARGDCPICGEDDWHGLGPQNPEPVILASLQPGGTVEAGTGFGTVGIACGNCGFIRLHSLKILGLE